MQISVQAEPFDYGALSNEFAQGHTHVGAVVTFCGIVRDDELGGLSTMEIEHYPGMTEKAIKAHAETAKDRFSLAEVLVHHKADQDPARSGIYIGYRRRHLPHHPPVSG